MLGYVGGRVRVQDGLSVRPRDQHEDSKHGVGAHLPDDDPRPPEHFAHHIPDTAVVCFSLGFSASLEMPPSVPQRKRSRQEPSPSLDDSSLGIAPSEVRNAMFDTQLNGPNVAAASVTNLERVPKSIGYVVLSFNK